MTPDTWLCVNCDTVVFATAENIRRHIRQCKKQPCPYCREKFEGLMAVLTHMADCPKNPRHRRRR